MPRNVSNSNKVILVVEDDEQVRKLVSAVLAKAGYIVVTAMDATLALRISREYRGKINALVAGIELSADSDEENRSFRADDDQAVAERHCHQHCEAVDRHGSRK